MNDNILRNSGRLSNIELLRILAMFLVLIFHANFFTFGAPTIESYNESPLFTFGQYFFESLSICCVNVFVLISGWFGIRPKLKSFLNFIFQCLFFLIGIYICCLLLGLTDNSFLGYLKGIAGCFALLKWNWFIKAYIGLYIIAPILNAFVEKANKREFLVVLIAFYIFQTIYSWMTGAAVFFEYGFSTLSFIGLYLLARYVRLYPSRLTALSAKYDMLIFGFCVLMLLTFSYISLISALTIHPKCLFLISKLFCYVNPIVIIMSLYLLLFFSKINFYNKFVNWLGASSFAVFLLHTNPNLCKPFFCEHLICIGEHFSGVAFLCMVFIYLLSVFIIAVLLDQIRILFWNKIVQKYKL